MKSQAATSGNTDRTVQAPSTAQKPVNGAEDASDKVVQPFAQQTLRPQ